jgi:hypothetical protein
LTALYIVLVVVIAVCVISLLRLASIVADSFEYQVFDLVVSSVFILELSLRMFCFLKVHKNIFSFFKNIFNFNDFIVVIFDIIVISLGATTGLRKFSSLTKLLRFFSDINSMIISNIYDA